MGTWEDLPEVAAQKIHAMCFVESTHPSDAILWLYPQLYSSFAFEFVVIEFTLLSQLIFYNKSQKAKDLHSIGYIPSLL